jgi:hypothetical protein
VKVGNGGGVALGKSNGGKGVNVAGTISGVLVKFVTGVGGGVTNSALKEQAERVNIKKINKNLYRIILLLKFYDGAGWMDVPYAFC